MRAICYKCDYSWNYKGKQRGKDHLSCPKCSYRLVAERVIVEDLHKQDTLLHSFNSKLHKKPSEIHTYIHDFERVSFEDDFNCLIQKELVDGFNGLPEEQEIIEVEEIENDEIEFVDQFGDEVEIKEIKNNIEIKIIPRDINKLLEHQRCFR